MFNMLNIWQAFATYLLNLLAMVMKIGEAIDSLRLQFVRWLRWRKWCVFWRATSDLLSSGWHGKDGCPPCQFGHFRLFHVYFVTCWMKLPQLLSLVLSFCCELGRWEIEFDRIWTFLLHSPPRSGTWFSQGTQAGRFGWTFSWWKVLDGKYLVQNGVDKIWPRYSYDTCWLKILSRHSLKMFETYVQKVEMKTPTKRFKLIATRRWNVPYAWIKTWPIPFNLDAE